MVANCHIISKLIPLLILGASVDAIRVDDRCRFNKDTQLDIVFVIDGSTSVGVENFRKVIEFLSNLIGRLPEDSRVGVVQFAERPRVELHLGQLKDLAQVKRWLLTLDLMEGPTQARYALLHTLTNVLNVDKGDRARVPDVVLVLTDGKSVDDPYVAASRMRQSGITTVALGISKYVDEEQLRGIAGDESRLFQVDDFSKLLLNESLVGDITDIMCKAAYEECASDVIMLVDQSERREKHLIDQQTILQQLLSIMTIGPTSQLVSLITYTDRHNVTTQMSLGHIWSKRHMASVVHDLEGIKGNSELGVALEHVRRQLLNRRRWLPASLIIFTDGQSTDSFEHAANHLRTLGVKIFTVTGEDEVANRVNLELVTGDPSRVLVDKTAVEAVIHHIGICGTVYFDKSFVPDLSKYILRKDRSEAIRIANVNYKFDGVNVLSVLSKQQQAAANSAPKQKPSISELPQIPIVTKPEIVLNHTAYLLSLKNKSESESQDMSIEIEKEIEFEASGIGSDMPYEKVERYAELSEPLPPINIEPESLSSSSSDDYEDQNYSAENPMVFVDSIPKPVDFVQNKNVYVVPELIELEAEALIDSIPRPVHFLPNENNNRVPEVENRVPEALIELEAEKLSPAVPSVVDSFPFAPKEEENMEEKEDREGYKVSLILQDAENDVKDPEERRIHAQNIDRDYVLAIEEPVECGDEYVVFAIDAASSSFRTSKKVIRLILKHLKPQDYDINVGLWRYAQNIVIDAGFTWQRNYTEIETLVNNGFPLDGPSNLTQTLEVLEQEMDRLPNNTVKQVVLFTNTYVTDVIASRAQALRDKGVHVHVVTVGHLDTDVNIESMQRVTGTDTNVHLHVLYLPLLYNNINARSVCT